VTELNKQPLTSPPLTGDRLIGLVFGALSTTALIPKLPKLIYQIHNHDDTLLSQLEAAPAPTVRLSLGMRLSIQCSEDGAFITPQRLQASVQVLEPEIRPGGLASYQQDYEMCQAWGVQPVPAVQKQAVTSAIPTLILSGQYDPMTSPAYGKLAAQTLSKSYFFLFPGVSHAVLFSNDCAASIVHAFWQTPTRPPDAGCLQRLGPPSFE
jgi:pimeloyl-ACP methyl ester carboxylesterase